MGIAKKLTKKARQSKIVVEPLEPRILFSADLFAIAPGDDLTPGTTVNPYTDWSGIAAPSFESPTTPTKDPATAEYPVIQAPEKPTLPPAFSAPAELPNLILLADQTDDSHGAPPEIELLDQTFSDDFSPVDINWTDLNALSPEWINLVFIDPTAANAEQVLSGLKSSQTTDIERIVIRLDSDLDGIAEITETLKGVIDINAMHIIGAGSDQGFHLGNSMLDVNSVKRYTTSLSAWGESLSEQGKILIYGNHWENTQSGRELIEAVVSAGHVHITAGQVSGNQLATNADKIQPVALSDRFAADHQLAVSTNASSLENTQNKQVLSAPGVNNANDAANNATDIPATSPPPPESTTKSIDPRHELVFIDTATPDYGLLLADLKHNNTDTQYETILIGQDEDGIDKIARTLAARSDADAIHVISHGNDGSIGLGGVTLDNAALNTRAEDIAAWAMGLSDNADILFYGCNLALSEKGTELIDAIAELSNRDVAASEDLTGHIALDGDWTLEYETGKIESAALLSSDATDLWQHTLLSYTVTNTNDSGAGSLRQAIIDANLNTGPDSINFSIAGGGTQIISLATELDVITDTIFINGSTQPDWAEQSYMPIIIDGNDLATGLSLGSNADGSEIRGLVLRDFSVAAISIDALSDNHLIAGNWLGQFNSDGTDAGTAEAITGSAIYGDGDSSVVGGSLAADRNVIVTEGSRGILLYTADGWNIAGNYFGTDTTGNAKLPSTINPGDGLHTTNDANSNTIGDISSSHKNIFAGLENGIYLDDSTTAPNYIYKNWFGLGADGTSVIPNSGSGILLSSADQTVIGGVDLGNTIVASGSHAIDASWSNTGTLIQGNFIGQNEDGSLTAANAGSGINVNDQNPPVTIGGINAGEGNIITASDGDGITVTFATTTGVAIRGNSIFGNAGLGIDLNDDSTTINDSTDADTGPNTLQNWAILNSVSINDAGDFNFDIDTTTLAAGNYSIDFYASTDRDGGAVEGGRYLHTATGVAGGVSSVSTTVAGVSVSPGEYITLTVTDSTGNTSEFSNYAVVTDSDSGGASPTDLQSTAALEGGLSINADGGNDIVLVADDGGIILQGMSQFTMEFRFEGDVLVGDGERTLVSYTTANDGDALSLYLDKAGVTESVALQINGSWSSIATDVDAFLDGTPHTLSLTWDQTAGDWEVFLDGASVGTGTGLATGQTIANSGTLHFGVDMDTGTDTFRPTPTSVFQGTLHDIRIFNDIRTNSEISAGYATTLPYDESGMVANWTFQDLSTDQVITDSVAGRNLNVTHLLTSGFSPGNAVLMFSVDENAVDGTLVGVVTGIDAERNALIASLMAADPDLHYNAGTGKFYKHWGGSGNYAAASANASTQLLNGTGGELATIHSAYENEIIQSIYDSTPGVQNHVWLGGSDATVEGEWRWSNGETFWLGDIDGTSPGSTYSNFTSTEPNGSTAENYLTFRTDGTWNDGIDSISVSAFLQWNADDVLDATQALTYSITSQSVTGAFGIDADTGTIIVSDGSLIDYETATSHNVTVEVTDADGNAYSEVRPIEVNNVYEITQSLPAAQYVEVDTPLVFSTVNGNAITVSDTVAADDTRLQVYISTNFNGTLNLSQTTGLSVAGGINGGTFMTIHGTESNLNAAFEGMTYTPVTGYSGPVNLTMRTSLGADLEGRYEFEGSAWDSSVGVTQQGTLSGATIVTDGTRGNVVELDGSGSSVVISDRFFDPANVTLAAWVNLTAADSNGAEVISLGDSIVLRLDDSVTGGLTGYYYDGAVYHTIAATGGSLAGSGWNHVAYVVDPTSNKQSLYLNGKVVSSTEISNPIAYTLGPDTIIGSHGNGNTTYDFNGLIDEARIYDRALSTGEIAALSAELTEVNDTFTITVSENSLVVAVVDTEATGEDTPMVVDPAANDTDTEGHTVSIVDFTQPANGSVVDRGDGILTYTPDANYTGADSFDYVAVDSGLGVQHYWGLDGHALDAIGGVDGVVTQAIPVAGEFGDGLEFDEVNDYITLPDIAYHSALSISFEFKIDDTTGSLFQYIYSHGDVNSTNSINVFLNEASHGTDPNVLRTVVRDANDTLDNVALEVDIASLVGDGQFHTYTMTANSTGLEVYLDGVLAASDSTRGSDGVDPAGNLYLSARHDLDTDRRFGGVLDTVQVFGKSLGANQITDLESLVNRETFNVTVGAINESPTFNVGDGVVVTQPGTSHDLGHSVLVQDDGKFVVAGASIIGGSDYQFLLMRYNADGSPDTSFNGTGIATTDILGSYDIGYSVAQQPDGKYVVAGNATNGAVTDFAIVRYNNDGTLDTTFDSDGKVTTALGANDDSAYNVRVQPDGKIVVAGYSNVAGNREFAVVRYNSNGSLDTTFGGTGIITTAVGSIQDYGSSTAIQPDGKILVGGYGFTADDHNFALIRYNVDGTLDTTFNSDGKVDSDFTGSSTDIVISISLQDDGKILVAGSTNANGTDDFAIMRYNANGTLDNTFNSTGKVITAIGAGNDGANSVAIQPDGRIVVGGYSNNGTDNDFAIVRYDSNGTLDTTFNTTGIVTLNQSGGDSGNSIAVQTDGSIILVGDTINPQSDVQILRVNSDGTLDEQFGTFTNTLNGNPTFVEGGAPVVLDADVKIFDEELSTTNDFSGSSLDLARNGGADADDLFDFQDANGITLGTWSTGGPLNYELRKNGTAIATLDYDTDGQVVFNFTNANGETPTQADVNNILSQITYSNTSDNPPASVQIDWTFDDGHVMGQGSGANQFVTGSTTVNITSINDAPIDISTDTQVNDAADNPVVIIGSQTGSQNTVATLASGRTVNVTVNGDHINAEIFSVAGNSLTGQYQILDGKTYGSFGSTHTDNPVIAALPDGGFVVASQIDGYINNGDYGTAVVLIAFDANGNPLDVSPATTPGPILVSNNTAGSAIQVTPTLDVAGDGTITVSWDNTTTGQFQERSFRIYAAAVAENAAVGTVVTALSGVDPEADSLTYSIVGDDNNFEIVGNNILVKAGAAFDYETRPLPTLTVRADDGNGGTYDEVITIELTNVNEAPTFSVGDGYDIQDVNSIGALDTGYAVISQPDGKILVSGFAETPSDFDFLVTRYNSDGCLDTSFGSGGVVTIDVVNAVSFNSITLQDDGKILLAGTSNAEVNVDITLIRLNSDGTFDSSFGSGGGGGIFTYDSGSADSVAGIRELADSKIILLGDTSSDLLLIMFTANGTLDTTFGAGTGIVITDVNGGGDKASSLTVLGDGKWLVSSYTFPSEWNLTRFNTDGSLDTSFGAGDGKVTTAVGLSSDRANTAVVADDGSIFVGGQTNTGGTGTDYALVKYDTFGNPDLTFGGGDGIATFDNGGFEYINEIKLQSDGKIIAVGRTANVTVAASILRFNTDGTLDSTFGVGGELTFSPAGSTEFHSIEVTASDQIIVTGVSDNDVVVARFSSDGILDSQFSTINTLDGNPTFVEGGAAVVLDADVQIFDPELSSLDNFNNAFMWLHRTGTANADDVFSATGNLGALSQGGGILLSGLNIGTVSSTTDGNLILTFNSNATQSHVNETIQSIAYANASDAPPSSVDITWEFNDGNTGAQGSGGQLTASGSTTVSITAVNDAPVLDLDADDSTLPGADFAALWTEGAGPAVIADGDATLTDIDNTNLTSLTVTITNLLDSANEFLTADTTGTLITTNYDSVTGVLTLSCNDTTANYQQVLRTLTYDNTFAHPNETSRTITFIANDGTDNGMVGTTTLTVVGTQDAGVTITAIDTQGIGEQITVSEQPSNGIGTFLSQAVAVAADGSAVVVWTSDAGQDGDNDSIMARLIDAEGDPIGNEFLVNSTGTDSQGYANVAMDDTGNFVVVWTSNNQDGDSTGIFAQRFDSTGTTQGGEFPVNTTTAGRQDLPTVTMTGNGEFIIAWEGNGADDTYGIFAQRFNALGAPQGSEFRINDTVTDDQSFVKIASDRKGNFVATWTSSNQDGSSRGVYMHRFDSTGNSLGGEQLVNTFTTGSQWLSNVAINDFGEFAIVWRDDGQAGSIYMQLFNADGTANSGAIEVPSAAAIGANYPQVAIDGSGNVTAVWQDYVDTDDSAIVARQFTSSGTPLGLQFLVNTHEQSVQEYPVISMNGAGQFVTVFTDYDVNDSGGYSIEMRRFGGATTEAGGTAGYSFVLDTQPTDDVTITLSMPDTTEGTLTTNSLTFTPADWNVAQIVTVTGVDDTLADGNISHLLVTTNASSIDSNYNAITLRDLNVTNLDNDPAIDLDADDSHSAGINFISTWTEGTGAVVIVDSDANLSDPDSATLSSLVVTITNLQDGASESLTADTNGTALVSSYNAGVLTLSGSDTVENYEKVLRTIHYNNVSQEPEETARTISFVASDGINTSEIATSLISIQNAADLAITAPVITVTNEDTAITYDGVNLIQIDDGIIADTLLQFSLEVVNGTLTLPGTTGLSFLSGSNSSSGMVLVGLETDINAALNGLIFTPNEHFNGSTNLTVELSLSANLEGHYTFESDANDQSIGTAHNGTLQGNATLITDPDRGQVLSLDGDGDSTLINGLFGEPANVTLAAWVNLDTADISGAEVISLGDNLVLRLDDLTDGMTLVFYDGASWNTIASGISIAGSGWHHVAATIDSVNNNQTLYLDGKIVATDNLVAPVVYDRGSDTQIGAHADSSGDYDFNGLIDDARIYSSALSADEIVALATDQATVTDTVTITVNPINDPPVLLVNMGASTNIGGSVTIDTTTLNEDDPDDNGAELTYTISNVLNGQVELNTTPGLAITSFTQADIDSSAVVFVHDGNSGSNGSFSFNLADGGEDGAVAVTDTFYISINSATSDSYATDENTGLNINAANGLLANDGQGNVPLGGNTVVGFDATTDTDGNAVWSSNTGTVDLSLSGATYTTTPDNAIPGIKAAFDFSGISSGATAPALDTFPEIDTTQAATLEAWVSFDSLASSNMIFDTGDSGGNGFSLHTSGNLLVLTLGDGGNTTFSSAPAPTIGSWHHIAVSIYLKPGKDQVDVYIDGSLQIATAFHFSNWGSGAFGLGTTNGTSIGNYNGDLAGQIAHFRIHDYDLSAATISYHAANPGASSTTPFVESYDASATAGSVTVSPDGRFNYEPNEQFEYLGAGQSTTDSFTYVYNDGLDNTDSANVVITINGVNDAPVQSAIETTALTYTENDAAAVITSTLSVSDVDDTQIDSATVSISTAYASGQDILSFTNQPGITGNFNSATGVLTLSGASSPANYQTALRSVFYENISDNPSTMLRTVTFQVNDGSLLSNTQSRTINIIAVNDAPVTNAIESTPLNTIENSAATVVSSAIEISDIDDSLIEQATVAITNNFIFGEDVLSFSTMPGISGAYNSSTGELTLTGSSSVANYETVLRSVTYQNVSDNPTVLARTVSYTINDGDVDSNLQSRLINIAAVNDAPVQSGIESSPLSVTENDPPVIISSTLSITDPDDTLIESATVTISANFSAAEDSLSFMSQAGITGTYDSASGTLALSGSATTTDYQARDINVLSSNDAPLQASMETSNLVYTENNTPVQITSTLKLSDVDDTNLESATVSISTNFQAGQDNLTYVNQAGISGSFNTTTGVLTLSGSATVASYQTALQSITYGNSSDNPSTLKRTVSFSVNDGDDYGNTVSRDIAFTAVNDTPVALGIEASTVAYIENDQPAAITNTITISDADDTLLESASVFINNNFTPAEDILIFTDQSGISGNYDNTSGLLTLTGSASVGNYQTALQSVRYENVSDNPSTLPREITFTVNDGDVDSDPQTRELSVTSVNDRPVVLAIASSALLYGENDLPENIAPAIMLTDVDDTLLQSATIAISSNYAPTEDTLEFPNQPGINSSFDPTTGVLTLTGSASITDYETAMQSVTYFNSSDDPSGLTRSITFSVTDASTTSDVAVRDLILTAINDAPVTSLIETTDVQVTENDAPIPITTTLTLADLDNTNLSSAWVVVTGNYQPGEDLLSFSGTPAINGSFDALTGTLQLSGTASVAQYEAALHNVTYSNLSDNPDTAARTISITVSDTSQTSNTSNRGIEITAVNDEPTLTNLESNTLLYVENLSPRQVSSTISLSDPDDQFIQAASVHISSGYHSNQDILSFAGTANISASWNSTTATLELTGSDTIAAYQAALRTVMVENTSDNPVAIPRTITFTINDGDAFSDPVSRNVSVVPVNDAPVTSAIETTPLRVQENSGGIAVTTSLSVADVDDAMLNSAIVRISGGYQSTEDLLQFSNTPNITGSWDSINGVMSLSGTDTKAAYQAALRNVLYQNTSDNPVTNDRTLEFNVFDGQLNSNTLSRTISVDSINDAPQGTDSTFTFLEDTQYKLSRADFGFSDALDNNAFIAVTIDQLPVYGLLTLQDVPVIAGQLIQVSDVDANLLVFTPQPDANGPPYDTVSFRVRDDGGITNGGSDIASQQNIMTFNITSVSDAPSGGDNTVSTPEDTAYSFSKEDFLFSDAQDNDTFTSLLITSLPNTGVLTNNGLALSTGQIISIADIDNGLLVYTPSLNVTGAAYNGFGFQVQDSGNIANGGEFTDPTVNFLSFDVPGVNDPPLLITELTTVDEGSENLLTTAVLNATDADDLLAIELTFSLDSVPLNGVLTLNGNTLSAQDTFTRAQIENNQLMYTHDGSETSSDFFDISVQDGGEDGALPSSGRFLLSITEVIDPAPVLESDNLNLIFGQSFNSLNGNLLDSGFSDLSKGLLASNSTFLIEIENPPNHGTVELGSSGTFTYTHDGSADLIDFFTYRVTNEDGVSSTARVDITVEPPLSSAFGESTPTTVEFSETPASQIEIDNPATTINVVTSSAKTSAVIDLQKEPGRKSLTGAAEEPDFSDTASIGPLLGLVTELDVLQHNKIKDATLTKETSTLDDNGLEFFLNVKTLRAEGTISNPYFLDSLSRLEDDLQQSGDKNNTKFQLAQEAALVVSFSATAGFIAWAFRGGALFATAMTSLPLWSSIDPLKLTNDRKTDEAKTEQETEIDTETDNKLEQYFSNHQ